RPLYRILGMSESLCRVSGHPGCVPGAIRDVSSGRHSVVEHAASRAALATSNATNPGSMCSKSLSPLRSGSTRAGRRRTRLPALEEDCIEWESLSGVRSRHLEAASPCNPFQSQYLAKSRTRGGEFLHIQERTTAAGCLHRRVATSGGRVSQSGVRAYA